MESRGMKILAVLQSQIEERITNQTAEDHSYTSSPPAPSRG